MVKRAQEVLERILELNENDNLGARYLLSGVYAYFEWIYLLSNFIQY